MDHHKAEQRFATLRDSTILLHQLQKKAGGWVSLQRMVVVSRQAC
jgi:hypothetical protein